MQGMGQFQQILWAVNVAVGIVLLALLIAREKFRAFPAFTGYLLLNLSQAVAFYFATRRWGYASRNMWLFGWSSQAVVTLARALAVAELCRHMLARYHGVWALAWRVLCASAMLVILYSGFAGRRRWELAFPALDRSLELSIAAVIVILLLFVRYYEVVADPVDRSLAVGLCLYSCFGAVNNTILDRYLYSYQELWIILGMLSFLASLMVWTWALRSPQRVSRRKEALLAPGIYESLAPQINLRLRTLNDRLSQFWNAESPRR
jgi:hypothetical protein